MNAQMALIKKTTITILSILIISSIFIINQSVQAGECQYGTIKAFYSKNQINWEQATVNNVTLKRGETFYIKAEITSKIDLLSIDLKIWETGEQNQKTSTFKQLTGPDCFFGVYDIIKVEKNKNFTLIWKFQVKPDTKWVNATAPINIFAQYDKNTTDNKRIYFTAVNPYIEDELWENYNPNKNCTGNIYPSNYSTEENTTDNNAIKTNTSNVKKTPGYNIILFFITISLTLLFIKRKRQT